MKIFPLFRATGAVACLDVGNAGWKDISTLITRHLAVRIDNYRPYETSTVLYLTSDTAVEPKVTEATGSGEQAVAVTTFRLADAAERDRLKLAQAADGAAPITATAGVVSRVEITVRDQGDHRAIRLDLGVAPTQALVRATVDLNNPKRATVCGISPSL